MPLRNLGYLWDDPLGNTFGYKRYDSETSMLSVISLPSFETLSYNSKISFLNRWHLGYANSLVAVHRTLNVIYC